jgi:hypothetical protein
MDFSLVELPDADRESASSAREALYAEHGALERDAEGLEDIAAMAGHGTLMAEADKGWKNCKGR